MVKIVYWFWEKKIPPTLCDSLISHVDSSNKKPAAIVNYIHSNGLIPSHNEEFLNSSFRNSDIIFEPWLNPIGSILFSHALAANYAAEWNFDLSLNCQEDAQLSYYYSNGHFSPHTDSIPNTSNSIRKITNILFLSNPDEYEGGELILKVSPKESDVFVFKPPKGSIIAFPSFFEHQVTPILSGERITAVLWASGPAFK